MILLDAVNTCLRYIGEMPVPPTVDIDSLSELHEAKIIRTTLQQTSREYQTRGWWFNKESWRFLPNSATGTIAIPVTVISLYGTSNTVLNRGGFLYDVDNQSLDFDDGVDCEVIWEVPFENLPSSFADLVTYATAKDIQAFLRGDTAADKRLSERIAQSYTLVQKEHLNYTKPNRIQGNRLVNRTSIPSGVI